MVFSLLFCANITFSPYFLRFSPYFFLQTLRFLPTFRLSDQRTRVYDFLKVCSSERKDLYFCKQIVSEAMEIVNLLHYATREELRRWLEENHDRERCCWVVTHRGKCPEWPAIPYIEVVEEALCFGWIDSTLKRLPDGRLAQRLSPRRAKSHWTELNRERCRSLEERGLMTEAGRQALAMGQQTEQTITPRN